MQPAKVKVYVALFCYGGNGGLAMMAPELGIWLMKNYHDMLGDERIESVGVKIYSDTPITLTRNRAVRDAKRLGCDMVLMLDSDNEPDGYLAPGNDSKPFWKTAFDFAYERLIKGIPTVIAAPYCGPPPPPIEQTYVVTNGDVTYTELYGGEVPYLFQWSNKESDNPHANVKIDLLTRNEASRLSGIYPVAALPTGVCLFTLNAFEGLPHPYFKYEMNEDGSEKQSTEDVVATRDISLYWKITKGYDVLFATCDSWALHHKTKKVGRPQFVPVSSVADTLAEAIRMNQHANEAIEYIDYTDNLLPSQVAPLPNSAQVLGPDVTHVTISPEAMERARQLAEQEEHEDTTVDEPSDTDVWEPTELPSSDDNLTVEPTNGDLHFQEKTPDGNPTLTYKMVAGRKVAIFNGFEISDTSLEGIEMLTGWMVNRKSGALEVAVVHSGTGQSTAVMNDALPSGSHIYALDCFTPHAFSTIPAEQFNKSFAPEIERGRIQIDNADRKMPTPSSRQHLDMVFIEQFVTEEKLALWLPHVQPGGVLAGLGYAGKAKKLVNKFAREQGLTIKNQGDVWVLPVVEQAQPAVDKDAVDEDDERADVYQEDEE